jgi:regulator of RNase E activity RraA
MAAGKGNRKDGGIGMIAETEIQAELKVLSRYSTPTVANAIELFEIRPRNEGYLRTPFQCLSPEKAPVSGYAVTCTVSCETPESYGRIESFDYWEHIESQPGPRIAVVQDLDRGPLAGGFLGEVNGAIHKALGCVGAVVDGAVRDLDEMRGEGLQVLYRQVIVSHGYIHPVACGRPIEIDGVTIRPGMLLQVDQYGVLIVPPEVLPHLEEAVKEIERRERGVLDYCRTGTATRAGLVETVTKYLRNHPKWRPESSR